MMKHLKPLMLIFQLFQVADHDLSPSSHGWHNPQVHLDEHFMGHQLPQGMVFPCLFTLLLCNKMCSIQKLWIK